MSDVRRVFVTVAAPVDGDPGRVSYGYYKLSGDKLTMTGEQGDPVTDRSGKRYEHTLKPGDDPDALAAVFTRRIRDALVGADNGFSRPINYSDRGIV